MTRTTRRSLLAVPLATPALAQAPWPQRTISLMVPYPPGGSTDNTARPVSQKLAEVLGQSVVIENRGGAGGTIGAAQIAQAKPDGYSFLCFPTAVMTISPHMMRLPYDPVRDLDPVAMLSISEGAMAMHPAVPLRDMAALIAHARANPNRLRFSSAGNGTITQLTAEIFAHSAGIQLEHVPYRGSAQALTAVMAGDVELQFDPVAVPAVKDGRLRGLATLGEERSGQLPDLPTLTELGLFNGGAYSWFGLAAPAGVPAEVTARLVAALGVVLADPVVARAMAPVGLRPRLEHGAAFARRVQQDRASFGEAVRRTGARAE